MLDRVKQLTADWIKFDQHVSSHEAKVMRARALFVSCATTIIYVAYALVSKMVYDVTTIAQLTSVSALIALGAILACRHSANASTAGHLYTLSLTFQIFGEMYFNGGLQAPATPLSLLIVLAAIFTVGISATIFWASITVLGVVVISVMDIMAVLPASEFPRQVQIGDRVVSLAAGITVSSLLIMLYERQARLAMTKLIQERAIFKHRALHDPLTDMPNRSYFYEQAQEAIKNIHHKKSEGTIFYFDIDGFKQVNDQLGHAVGDQLLQAFSVRLQSTAGETDFAARLAGDEFAMVSAISDRNSTRETCERLRRITDTPFELNGKTVNIGLSIGCASFPKEGEHLELLLNIADNRMYADKAKRREAAAKFSRDEVSNIPAKSTLTDAPNSNTEPAYLPDHSNVKSA